MPDPRASLDDIYNQNRTIIGHLERLNENIYLIREALYGQTSEESGTQYEQPKHGEWGVIAESVGQIERYLSSIDDKTK